MQVLEKYLNKRYETIGILLGKPQRLWVAGTFHQLRVEIKKLNAAFEMIKASAPGFKKNKYFRPLKIVFKQAGKVRELQVEEALLKEHSDAVPNTSYLKLLNKEKQVQRHLFFSLLDDTLIQKMLRTREKVIPHIAALNPGSIENFLSDKARTIKTLLYHPSMSNEQLHDLRKELKRYHYDLRSLQLSDQVPLQIASDELMEHIGNWHDKEICMLHLNNAIGKVNFSEKEKKQLTLVLKDFKTESTRLYQKIKHMMVQAVLQETGGEHQHESGIAVKASA